MSTTRVIALGAGIACISAATLIQGILPAVIPESRTTKVTKVVRTDIGELKWMVSDATDYTPEQAAGRKTYVAEGCWYCHSQFVRPVTGETRRWGPVAQAGEYAFDQPHLFSTRRIGPDLSRVGLKYNDDWHLAHFWNPRSVVADSIMPRFAQFFDGPHGPVALVDGANGARTVEQTAATEALFDFDSKDKILLTPNRDGLTFVREKGKYPVIHTPNQEYTGDSVTLVASTERLENLIAYLQKLGINRGKWRELFFPQRLEINQMTIPASQELLDYGKEVYERRCVGCHGVSGNGNGLAATFLEVRPRNFNYGVFKFRVTPSGSLPTDGDLLRTITRGVRGTAMPTFHMLAMKDRLAVIQHIKYEFAADRSDPENPYVYFAEEQVEQPVYLGHPPEPSPDMVARGKTIWQEAKCWECHGDLGEGDGEKADELEDDFGYPIPPANLVTGLFKSGGDVKDIYRTITTGLNGTPMPSYADSFGDEDRWALAYYVLALSAFKDPLTGEPLQVSAVDRDALNDPALDASETQLAYQTKVRFIGGEAVAGGVKLHARFAGEAWADKKGFDFVESGPRTTGPVATSE
ncbi:MAG: cbb3-type cytochrome c oxidase subunit II [Gammaproteobacteria bacterium]